MKLNSLCFLFLLSMIYSLKLLPSIDKPSKDTPPPIFPRFFSHNWDIYLLNDSSPYPDNGAGLNRSKIVGTGSSYYDWYQRRMVEQYDKFCFPLFEYPSKDFMFPCRFINFNETSYVYMPNQKSHPPCCYLAKNFHPPSPDFARRAHMKYNSSLKLTNGKTVDFWHLNMIIEGEENPFYFGWYRETVDGYRVPGEFVMLAADPSGVATQIFRDFKIARPKESIFDLPDICKDAKECIWNMQQDPNYKRKNITHKN